MLTADFTMTPAQSPKGSLRKYPSFVQRAYASLKKAEKRLFSHGHRASRSTTELGSSSQSTSTLSTSNNVLPSELTFSKPTAPVALENDHYLPFLSQKARNLQPNPIRNLTPLESVDGMISLLAGKPNPTMFPISSISFAVQNPGGDQTELSMTGKALEEAMQYNLVQGLPALIEWATELQEIVHHRYRSEGWAVSIGVGSADLISKCINGLFNAGDSILIESPAYPGVIPLIRSLGVECIEIPTDQDGLLSDVLTDIMNEWPEDKQKPKALYTVPVGSNPSGCTTSAERKRDILVQANKHDFLILEDDPYYYLYYGDSPRPPSYFTLEAETDTIGRVVRFDSFSKVISSGFRLGFVTGPAKIVEIINGQTALGNLQPSTFVQSIMVKILQSWGHKTFLAHTENIAEFYKAKRDVFVAALERHLGDLAEWDAPSGGMFLWVKLNLPTNADGECDSGQVIRDNAVKSGVLALPGFLASPNGNKTPYCRISFSLLPEDKAEEACRRLAQVVREAHLSSQSTH